MYFWVNFLLWNVGTLWFGLFIALGLEPRWEKLPRWVLAVVFSLLVMPIVYLKIRHPLSDALYGAAFFALLLYAFAAFRDRPWKKLLLILLFIACTEISEFPMTFFVDSMHIPFDESFNSLQMTMLVAADTLLVFILTSLLLMFWNRLIAHRTVLHRTFIYLIFPISQFVLLLAFDDFYPQASSLNHLLASIGALLGLLADFILLYVLLEQEHKEALERKLQELETLRRVEEVHYQAIEARREQLAKIRHDFNNQLTAAYTLISRSDREIAGNLLDELKSDIAKTKEYAYCANAIANAVITEKAAECEEHGIRLTTEIELPEEPPIQAVQLCSVFSNLFDNAIKAAKECAEGERFVSVRATHHGDYLHVKVENSAPDPKTKKESARKKYGQEILADIASRYDGELNYSWKDGVYSAIVSLTVREASPALHGG